MSFARTLGELRQSPFTEQRLASRHVKDELRENLMARLREGSPCFPASSATTTRSSRRSSTPSSRATISFLLGLRGQAKSRILRALTTLLDPEMPYIAGCEIHDNPYAPICRRCRDLVAERGDATPIAWLTPDHRYVEKLATPDVTIADLIGDIDPIKAARGGHELSSEFTVHYGLLPRANRGIFAINELPDLAGKIQVGLFNIMQEGDVQIKGYPIRLPLDVAHGIQREPRGLHGARQNHHAAEGPHRLRDPHALSGNGRGRHRHHRAGGLDSTRNGSQIAHSEICQEVIERIAFAARDDKKIDKRSGVSQRLPISAIENVVSNAERRALTQRRKIDRPPHQRHLRGPARHHRQARTGIRR